MIGTKGIGSVAKVGKLPDAPKANVPKVTPNTAVNLKSDVLSKVEEVKQQLRQLRTPSYELAGVNVGRITDNGTVGKNTPPSNPKPSTSSKPPQNSSNSKPVEATKGTGDSGKHLGNVPRLDEIEVNFKRNPKHDSEEFARQLKDQEKGMNELTVEEYLKNRERYIAEGRSIEGNAAQQAAREKALNEKIEELFESGLSWDDAQKQAESWLKTKAALHNPDQIAGGNPLNIDGVGDTRINSSIGSQWKYRIDKVDEKIEEIAENMTPEQLQSTYLNVKFTH